MIRASLTEAFVPGSSCQDRSDTTKDDDVSLAQS